MWNPEICLLVTSEIPLDFSLLLSQGLNASTVYLWTEACHVQVYMRPDTSQVLLLNHPLRHFSHSLWDFGFCTRPYALSNRGIAWIWVATLFGDTVIKQIKILLYILHSSELSALYQALTTREEIHISVTFTQIWSHRHSYFTAIVANYYYVWNAKLTTSWLRLHM